MTNQGFRIVRENAREVIIQHPNKEIHKVTHGNFTTLKEYADSTDTPFKLDDEGNRIYNPAAFYLDYFNNFITTDKIAECYGLSEKEAEILIKQGKEEFRINSIKTAIKKLKKEVVTGYCLAQWKDSSTGNIFEKYATNKGEIMIIEIYPDYSGWEAYKASPYNWTDEIINWFK